MLFTPECLRVPRGYRRCKAITGRDHCPVRTSDSLSSPIISYVGCENVAPLGKENVQNITAELNVLLADVFALYLKTKNFHWHISGPHFRL